MRKPVRFGQLERQAKILRMRFAVLKFLNRFTKFSIRYWVEMRMVRYQQDAEVFNRRYDQWAKELKRATKIGHSYR